MKLIKLTKGYSVKVDNQDYEYLTSFKWFAVVTTSGRVYAGRRYRDTQGKQKTKYMHRVIMGDTAKGLEIDHINGDSLDNQSNNLRAVTHFINMQNMRMSKVTKTGVIGVHKLKATGRYQVQRQRFGKRLFLGNYDSLEEAKQAYSNG